jgi:hypothetical protein
LTMKMMNINGVWQNLTEMTYLTDGSIVKGP